MLLALALSPMFCAIGAIQVLGVTAAAVAGTSPATGPRIPVPEIHRPTVLPEGSFFPIPPNDADGGEVRRDWARPLPLPNGPISYSARNQPRR